MGQAAPTRGLLVMRCTPRAVLLVVSALLACGGGDAVWVSSYRSVKPPPPAPAPAPPSGTQQITLQWAPSATDASGNPYSNLAGFIVRYGTTQGGPYTGSKSVDLSAPVTYMGDVQYVTTVTGLDFGVWYFSISEVDTSGIESDPFPELSFTI